MNAHADYHVYHELYNNADCRERHEKGLKLEPHREMNEKAINGLKYVLEHDAENFLNDIKKIKEKAFNRSSLPHDFWRVWLDYALSEPLNDLKLAMLKAVVSARPNKIAVTESLYSFWDGAIHEKETIEKIKKLSSKHKGISKIVKDKFVYNINWGNINDPNDIGDLNNLDSLW